MFNLLVPSPRTSCFALGSGVSRRSSPTTQFSAGAGAEARRGSRRIVLACVYSNPNPPRHFRTTFKPFTVNRPPPPPPAPTNPKLNPFFFSHHRHNRSLPTQQARSGPSTVRISRQRKPPYSSRHARTSTGRTRYRSHQNILREFPPWFAWYR